MNTKILDRFLEACLLAACLFFGILGDVWLSAHGASTLVSAGFGLLVFLLSLGLVLIVCCLVGVLYDLFARHLKKTNSSALREEDHHHPDTRTL